MPTDLPERDPLELLAEEFQARFGAAERPALTEYVERHPELAAEIRELFPALVMMEEAGRQDHPATGPVRGHATGDGRHLERLGDYRIIREIGRGGMGIVYEAEHESLGRHVALKVLPFCHAEMSTSLARFHREARAAARLHHTNIVPVFDVGERDGLHFYAMQYIAGQGLDQVLAEVRRLRRGPSDRSGSGHRSLIGADENRRLEHSLAKGLVTGDYSATRIEDCLSVPSTGDHRQVTSNTATNEEDEQLAADSPTIHLAAANPASNPESNSEPLPHRSDSSGLASGTAGHYYRSIAQIGLQVADALAYAHRQKVLHRDIKPSNLLLDERGAVWITDFGLAKDDGADLTQTGDIVGTLRYMAPERFRGVSDARCDIYSLGATLYELLTLQSAFGDSDRARLVRKIIQDEPLPPSKVDNRVPRDLETIVLKAMSREPGQRYQAADNLAEDLRRFVGDRPIQARRVTLVERGWLWSRRNPQLAGLLSIVTALLLVIGVGAAFARLLQTERDDAQTASQTIAALQRETEIRSLLGDATKSRMRGKPGRRGVGLDLVRRVVELQPDRNLRDGARNEAIATLALTDASFGAIWAELPAFNTSLSFDAELTRCGVLDRDGPVWIRGRESATPVQSWDTEKPPLAKPTMSQDGQWFAVPYDVPPPGALQVWHVATGRPVFKLPVEYRRGIDFSPDSRRLAVVGWDDAVHLWDLSTGREVTRLRMTGVPADVAFDPAGTRLAVCFANPGVPTLVVDIATHRVLSEIPSRGAAESVGWHPDGERLAVGLGSPNRGEVWDVARRRCLVRLEGHQQKLIAAQFDFSGRYVVTDSLDGTTRCWDADSGAHYLTFDWGVHWTNCRHAVSNRGVARDGPEFREFALAPSAVFSTLASRSGQGTSVIDISPVDSAHDLLAVAMTDGFSIWDLSTRRELAHVETGPIFSLRFDWETGILVTVGADGLGRWLLGPKEANSMHIGTPEFTPIEPAPTAGSFAAQAPYVAILQPGSARIVDFDGVERTSLTLPEKHEYVKLSPNGQSVATYSWHKSITDIWDAETGELRHQLTTSWTDAVEFSPDSSSLITARDTGYDVWDVTSGAVRLRIERTELGYPCAGDMTPDGRILAVESFPGVVGLVDSTTGEALCLLEGPQKVRVRKIRFNGDGTILLLVTDRAVHVWDLRRLRHELAELELDWDRPAMLQPAGSTPVAPTALVEKVDDAASASPQAAALRKASAAYNRAIASDGPIFRAANDFAWAMIMSPRHDSDWTRAIALAEEAVVGNVDEPAYRQTCGAALCRAGRVWDGLQWLESARISDDDYLTRTRGFFWRAIACGRLNDWVKARELFLLGCTSQRLNELSRDDLDPDLQALRQEAQRLLEGDYREWLSACNSPYTPMDYFTWGDRAFLKGLWQEAIDDLTEVLNLDDRVARAYWIRGQCYARTGQHAKAAKDFGAAFDLQFNDEPIGQIWANLTLYLGDAQGYAAVCAKMRERFGSSSDRLQACRLSWALFQGPATTPEKGVVIPLKPWLIAGGTEGENCIECTALAGIYLRNGQYDVALHHLDASDRLAGDWHARPLNDLLRAIALIRLGRVAEARPFVEKSRRFGDENLKSSPQSPFGEWSDKAWWDWYSFQILRRELEELLKETGEPQCFVNSSN